MTSKSTIRDRVLKVLKHSKDGMTLETLRCMDDFCWVHRTTVPLALRLLLQGGLVERDSGGVYRACRKPQQSYRMEEGLAVFQTARGPLTSDAFIRRLYNSDTPEWKETRRGHIILGMLSKSGAIRRVSRGFYVLAGAPTPAILPTRQDGRVGLISGSLMEELYQTFQKSGVPFTLNQVRTSHPNADPQRVSEYVLNLTRRGYLRRVAVGTYTSEGCTDPSPVIRNDTKFGDAVLRCIPARGAVGPRDICLLLDPAVVAGYKNLEVLRISVTRNLSNLVSLGKIERPFPGKYCLPRAV